MSLSEKAAKAAEEQRKKREKDHQTAEERSTEKERKFLLDAYGIEPTLLGTESVARLTWKREFGGTVDVVVYEERRIWLLDDVRVTFGPGDRGAFLVLNDVQHGQYMSRNSIQYRPFHGDGYTGPKSEMTAEERQEYTAAGVAKLLKDRHPVFSASGRVCDSCGQVIR